MDTLKCTLQVHCGLAEPGPFCAEERQLHRCLSSVSNAMIIVPRRSGKQLYQYTIHLKKILVYRPSWEMNLASPPQPRRRQVGI